MLDLGTLKIGVEVDDSQASSQLSSLSDRVEQTESSMNSAASGSKNLDQSLNNLSNQTQQTTQKVSAFQVMVGSLAAKAVSKLASTIKNSLGSAISRVDTLNNYTKTMEALGFTASEAEIAQEKLGDSIEKLPVALNECIATQQKYVALFDDMEEATDITIALQDATLAAGQGTEVASRAQEHWYSILANGKPELEHWKALTTAMPAQMKQLAQSLLGTSASSQDLFNAWKDGTVSTKQVTEALKDLDKNGGEGFESFASQAETATGGLRTSLDNMKIAVTKSVASIIQSFGNENIESTIGNITDTIYKIGNAASKVAGILGQLSPILGPLIKALGTFIAVLGTYSLTAKAVTAAQTALNAVMMMNPFVLAAAAIAALVVAGVSLYKNWDKVKAKAQELWNKVAPIFDGLKDKWNALKKTVGKIVNAVVESKTVQTAIKWVKQLIEWWNKLKDLAKKAITFVVKKSGEATPGLKGDSKSGHRVGLREVPYDDYDAVLHKGETILTAAETNQYKKYLRGLEISKPEARETIQNNDNKKVYNIGDVTLDVSRLKDVPTLEEFVDMLIRAKQFA